MSGTPATPPPAWEDPARSVQERLDAARAEIDRMAASPLPTLEFEYVNYRGERGRRTVIPLRIWYGATEYHPAPQWLLDAYDLDKGASRTFALQDMTFEVRPPA